MNEYKNIENIRKEIVNIKVEVLDFYKGVSAIIDSIDNAITKIQDTQIEFINKENKELEDKLKKTIPA